jgi:hypothetical protein
MIGNRATAGVGLIVGGMAVATVNSIAMAAPQSIDPAAQTIQQCPQVTRQFVQAQYEIAMIAIGKDYGAGSPDYVAREQQAREFWLVQRFQENVSVCQEWFNSGRTIPFRPT